MNKELILKYKAEFAHWLNGGSILVKYANPKQAAPGYTDWHEDDSVWNSNLDYLIVINDDYAIYRKALAEGKTVEVRKEYDYKELNEELWRLFAIGCSTFDLPVECYRIKPEEPKFKVGDFVRYIHTNSQKPLRIININCERYYFENAEIILRVDEIEKWEPKGGEVCIFWDNKHTNEAIIARYSHSERSFYYPLKMPNSCYQNCMPFTGVLPPHIKD